MQYEVGSLVKARGRDWVVLPSEDASWYLLKPLGGTDAEILCLSPELETIEPATFSLPDPAQAGDARSCALLRNAVRLGFRSTCGPFRSFGRIAVEPRPYQIVPLLMALKQAVVRLLISDDVGIGKTIEAALIARELIDRGEVQAMSVVCPPQLAEQWQIELEEKFHLHAELVIPSTVARLERGLGLGKSLFEVYPYTIVSLDYIKTQKHCDEFVRVCPELVIVDEAHICASAEGKRSSQQRYELIRRLAKDQNRHMIFVTATPHSGKEDVFHSLLSFLSPTFEKLPEDMSGKENEEVRRELARYFIQRRRGDIRAYMDAATPFPERKTGELTWKFSQAEQVYFQKVIALARDSLKLGEEKDSFSQRIFWWSTLALLRAVTSSPHAAKATLRNRAFGVDFEDRNIGQLDAEARQMVYDFSFTDDTAVSDTLAGADGSDASLEIEESVRNALRHRYHQLAREAEKLEGVNADSKLKTLIVIVTKLIKEGYCPVVFCRFILTAEYVCEHLGQVLPKNVSVMAVTGMLAPEEREHRVVMLADASQRVLVCTDCLSEGINLQTTFNAVVHYDLSWNPTRHEQREGRVDRFGQPFSEVKVITLYGEDNPIDGYVLNVLLRKHEAIRKALGISVPFPEESDKVMHAILESFLLHQEKKSARSMGRQQMLPGMEDFVSPEKKRLEKEWEKLALREEHRSHTIFAQQLIKVDDVAREIRASSIATGDAKTVESFVSDSIIGLGGTDTKKAIPRTNHILHELQMDSQTRRQNRGLNFPDCVRAVYSMPVRAGQTLLTRTHPFVEALADYVFNTAMDPKLKSIASRSGVMRTDAVERRTTILLCRFRYMLETISSTGIYPDLTEECVLMAFSGPPSKAIWLDESVALLLLDATPKQNVDTTTTRKFLSAVNEGMSELLPHVRATMQQRAAAFLDAHRRVREASRERGIRYKVTAQGEPDMLGIFIYLPVMQGEAR